MKKVSIFTISYALSIITWIVLSAKNLAIDNQMLLNLSSISLGIVNINALYLLITSSKDILKKQIRPIFCALMIVFTIYINNTILMYGIIALYLIALLFFRMHLMDLIIIVASAIMVYFEFYPLLCLLLVLYTLYATQKLYGFKNISQLMIVPIKKEWLSIFVFILMVIFSVIIYFLDLDTLQGNIMIHLVIFIFELLIFFRILEHPRSAENVYNSTTELYYLSEYLSKERINFSEILHDEILQDIIAACNMLELKNPDTSTSLTVLRELQNRIRKLMNYYHSVIFYDYKFNDNFDSIFDTISSMYPNKEIRLNFHVEEKAKILLENQDLMDTSLKISKELINNVYKHSDASFIDFCVYEIENNLIIECSNDGVTEDNYREALESKGGLLILEILISSHGGNIEFNFTNNILKVLVRLEEKDENSYI